jgi:prepilin-type N-terminal cleavage/methylation domain-containing protein
VRFPALPNKSTRSPGFRARRARRNPPGRSGDDGGFTLIELLIVVTILPIVIGGLSVGLLQVFQLQSSVSNRLNDTADSQVVSVNYQKDVQGAAYVTTAPSSAPQCGTGNQLLGLESNYSTMTNQYQTIISYASVQIGTGYSLVRLYCTGGSQTPSLITTISGNISSNQQIVKVNYTATATDMGDSTHWVAAKAVLNISFTISEPNSTEPGGFYTYTLVAAPEATSVTTGVTGVPSTQSKSSLCQSATPGTGTYASQLCLVDFSSLTGSDLAAASGGGCLHLAAALPGGYTLFFCLSISGGPIKVATLPTYPQAFLGNSSTSGNPFYTGINGGPALYQNQEGATDVITFNYVSVVAADGSLATGWQLVSADAETTDQGESITWTTGTTGPNLYWLPNSATSIVGNACGNVTPTGTVGPGGAGFYGNGTQTMTCSGGSVSNPQLKTGTPMVEALTPSMMQATLVGTGLEAIAFGVMVS